MCGNVSAIALPSAVAAVGTSRSTARRASWILRVTVSAGAASAVFTCAPSSPAAAGAAAASRGRNWYTSPWMTSGT